MNKCRNYWIPMEQDQRSVRLSTSMPKLGTEKMAALSNATHRKTKAKPGSRILLRKRFISDEKLPKFYRDLPPFCVD